MGNHQLELEVRPKTRSCEASSDLLQRDLWLSPRRRLFRDHLDGVTGS